MDVNLVTFTHQTSVDNEEDYATIEKVGKAKEGITDIDKVADPLLKEIVDKDAKPPRTALLVSLGKSRPKVKSN